MICTTVKRSNINSATMRSEMRSCGMAQIISMILFRRAANAHRSSHPMCTRTCVLGINHDPTKDLFRRPAAQSQHSVPMCAGKCAPGHVPVFLDSRDSTRLPVRSEMHCWRISMTFSRINFKTCCPRTSTLCTPVRCETNFWRISMTFSRINFKTCCPRTSTLCTPVRCETNFWRMSMTFQRINFKTSCPRTSTLCTRGAYP